MKILQVVQRSSVVLGLLVLAGAPASAQVNLLTNGDFEAPVIGGQYTAIGAGSPMLTGWTVGGGGIDLVRGYWPAASGAQSVDLSAQSAGFISQTVPTVVGETYNLLFQMAGHPDGGSAIKQMVIAITGQSDTNQQFNTTGLSRTNMGWSPRSLSFVATASNTTITFSSLTNNPFGPAVDNIRLFGGGVSAAAPEPATLLLFGCGGLVMSVRMRRRSSKKQL